MKSQLLVALTAALFLSACASPTVVQSVKAGDNGLTCPQLQNEYQDAEKVRADADKEKGMTGGNGCAQFSSGPPFWGRSRTRTKRLPQRIHAKSIWPT
jgi:hypothetical protein